MNKHTGHLTELWITSFLTLGTNENPGRSFMQEDFTAIKKL